MTRSMTGFARSQATGTWGTLTWEIRAVNHRYLDLRLRLPDVLRDMEPTIRKHVSAQLSRGKVELNARLEGGAAEEVIEIDRERLRALAEALETLHATVPGSRAPDQLEMLKYPGIQHETQPDVETLQHDALDALQPLLVDLQSMRAEEGERLAGLLRDRAARLGEHVDSAAQRLPEVRRAWYDKMRARLEELDVETDPARLEQEMLFVAQRMDVSEELDRVRSHIQALEDALDTDEPIGRRLDFLMQEFNREANTLGSKAQDTALTDHVMEMKVLIEQMREQVQNIE